MKLILTFSGVLIFAPWCHRWSHTAHSVWINIANPTVFLFYQAWEWSLLPSVKESLLSSHSLSGPGSNLRSHITERMEVLLCQKYCSPIVLLFYETGPIYIAQTSLTQSSRQQSPLTQCWAHMTHAVPTKNFLPFSISVRRSMHLIGSKSWHFFIWLHCWIWAGNSITSSTS